MSGRSPGLKLGVATFLAVAVVNAACDRASAQTAAAPVAAVATPADGAWHKVRFTYTHRPLPQDAWLAALFRQYLVRHDPDAPPFTPVTFGVFQVGPTRTVVAMTAADAACEGVPNSRFAKLQPDHCPTHVFDVETDGRVRNRTLREGCFLWIDPTDGTGVDPNANATYIRRTGEMTIELRTLISGRPVPSCHILIRP